MCVGILVSSQPSCPKMGLSCLVFFSLLANTLVLARAGNSNGCGSRQFKLSGMEQCHNWLNCSDLKNLKFGRRIDAGSTKLVHAASWNGLNIVVLRLHNNNYKSDFDHGLEMLEKYNPSKFVVQLIGTCRKASMFASEYYELGNATNILSVINKRYGHQNIVVRLKLCLNYAQLLEFLHDGPAGTRVMCDSNDLGKLLSQLLITDDVELVLNDLDALPLVDKDAGTKIKCGSRELFGDFVAPEQKWPFSGAFKDAAMPGYDEKTDIWKAAEVFKYLVSDIDVKFEWVRYRLFNLIKSCKNPDPNLRPTAKYLVTVLEKILAEVHSVKTEL